MPRPSLSLLLSAAALAVVLGGCGRALRTAAPGQLEVVAAESSWGSIAAQLAGGRALVHSIIVNPGTDPHAYEPTAGDGVLIARSRLAIVNGVGYDGWAQRLLDANPSFSRQVVDVGELLALKAGANPHQWYSPPSVRRVIARITAAYQRLDPAHAAYFAARRTAFERRALAGYDRLRALIRARYAGVPVGYSESIFQPLGEDLHLRLLTPASFPRAISEGSDVSAADKQTVDAQAQRHAIAVWVYNRQNVTPDVQRVTQLARAAHIPVSAITETPSPARASFQGWQTAQLQSLRAALHQATGR